MSAPVYLDHNSTTPPDPAVIAAMTACLEQAWGNASSLHAFGQAAARVLDAARSRVARLIGAEPADVIFTSGGTEANNHVLFGIAGGGDTRRHLVTTAIEHPAILNPAKRLESHGWQVTYVAPDTHGQVTAAAVAAAMTDATALVSIMLANHETGVLQPVSAIARLAHARGVPIHCDAVQAVGKIPVDVSESNVDFLSLSAHKLYGPKGVGALFLRPPATLQSLLLGGHQEDSRRAGTENLPGIAGLGMACELAAARLTTDASRIAALRDQLQAGIGRLCPDARVNGAAAPRLANTLNVAFPGVDNSRLVMNLDLLGVAVSTGSACTATSREPSHVLLAMGCPPELALNAIRLTLGRGTTEQEVDQALAALAQLLPRLRRHPQPHDAQA